MRPHPPARCPDGKRLTASLIACATLFMQTAFWVRVSIPDADKVHGDPARRASPLSGRILIGPNPFGAPYDGALQSLRHRVKT